MNEIDCARMDLGTVVMATEKLFDDIAQARERVSMAVADLREHLNRMEVDAEAEAVAVDVPAPIRRRVAHGSSVTADPGTVFRAQLERGDPVARAIMNLLESLGLKIGDQGNSGKHGSVRCMATMEAIYLKDPQLLEDTMRVIVSAWEGNVQSLRADFVGGVASFIADYGEGVVTNELIRRLKPLSPVDIVEATKGDRRRNMVAYLADVYTR